MDYKNGKLQIRLSKGKKYMKQLIKEEIYKFIQTQDMTKEEIKVIDTYVLNLLENLEPLFKIQESLKNEDTVRELANLILKDLGENIGQRNT